MPEGSRLGDYDENPYQSSPGLSKSNKMFGLKNMTKMN